MILLVYLSRHRVLNILKREEKVRTDSENDKGDFHEDTYSIVGKSEEEEERNNNSAKKRSSPLRFQMVTDLDPTFPQRTPRTPNIPPTKL